MSKAKKRCQAMFTDGVYYELNPENGKGPRIGQKLTQYENEAAVEAKHKRGGSLFLCKKHLKECLKEYGNDVSIEAFRGKE